MRIVFHRKKAYPSFYKPVKVAIDGIELAEIENGETFCYNGDCVSKITLHGPGDVDNLNIDLDEPYTDIKIDFRIAMGLFAGGFIVKVIESGEVVRRIKRIA